MTEYSIYTICNGGRPYYGVTYYTFEECREALYSIIEYNKQHRKMYYVDNDFFKNDFPYYTNFGFYYSIHCREVSEWKKYNSDVNITNRKNNIINFPFLA